MTNKIKKLNSSKVKPIQIKIKLNFAFVYHPSILKKHLLKVKPSNNFSFPSSSDFCSADVNKFINLDAFLPCF